LFCRCLNRASALIALGKSRDALYENVLAENEREAVADLLQYLENVSLSVALRKRSSVLTRP
jgi:hypothetical protein